LLGQKAAGERSSDHVCCELGEVMSLIRAAWIDVKEQRETESGRAQFTLLSSSALTCLFPKRHKRHNVIVHQYCTNIMTKLCLSISSCQ
jgi:hypothetical protein